MKLLQSAGDPVRILFILLFFLLSSGCEPQKFEVNIPFQVQFNGHDLGCATTGDAVSLTDLRFFIHDLRLIGLNNQQIPVRLIPDGVWQDDTVALLDFEDGEGACMNGSARMNTVLRGLSSDTRAKGLVFEIGVPESLNHADPIRALPPLNYTDMHWHWASGYKFLRGGYATLNDGFWMHLGSSRCQGTIGDIQGCRSANRPTIMLDGFEPGKHAVIIDLAALFSGAIPDDGRPSDCSSGPAEVSCEKPFAALGIDFATGNSVPTNGPFELGLIE